MLGFDEATQRILDAGYDGSDAAQRRRWNFDRLAPRPGWRVVDIGCGAGHQTVEIARAVGPDGAVVGVDSSDHMLAAARRRCRNAEHVTLIRGKAEDLPVDDGWADAAVSLQVFEYLDHDGIARALREARRVLRPGGRLVIGDMHWGTLVWRSDHPDRMARICKAWDGHLATLAVPEVLPEFLTAEGFEAPTVAARSICDTDLRPDGLARLMMILISRYLRETGLVAEAEVAGWQAEQEHLARRGRFFFSITHFVTTARRTDEGHA